ncbi:MAG: single-stranded-DNA-specific exonuclease RecJ, partial [Rhizobiaceae bacterium]|nr:single-stranded-DNA-specific exonuclease RecJ [Rhizobiaceae bacterium]
QAGPYGAGYPPPVFALPRHRLIDLRPVGQGHLRLELQSEAGRKLTGMAFRAADGDLGRFLLRSRGQTIHVAGSLSANHWNGNTALQFRVVDAAAAG